MEKGRPMGVNNRMRIASTSKAFNGAVALSLVSKGALPKRHHRRATAKGAVCAALVR